MKIYRLLYVFFFVTLSLTSCIQDPGVKPIIPVETKIQAAKDTAIQSPSCQSLGDFYWSIGDQTGKITQDQVGTKFSADTRMAIFSASKLIFSTYVIQKTNGVLTQSLIKGLNFTSGYTGPSEKVCIPSDTVASCFTREHSQFEPSKVGTFVYASGHMQKIAANELDMNLGPLSRDTLASELMNVLGSDLDLKFEVNELGLQAGPILAGAMNTTPVAYEKLLTKIVSNQLKMLNFLGKNTANTPIVSLKYSLGHWVEPDGSFSSVGALGFYPWISANKKLWGILARVERNPSKTATASTSSTACGEKIRKAYTTGKVQL